MSNDTVERLRYYQRQFLGAEDFTAEQTYQRSMRRRHNVGPHLWGIVAGLELVEVENAAGGVDVYVLPGMALDGFGRELIVLQPAQLAPSELLRFQGRPGVYGLWIGFADELAGRAREELVRCEAVDPFGRVRETFTLVVEPREPTHDPLTVAGQAVGTSAAADPSDASAEVADRLSVPRDESAPYQQLPEDEDDPRWLVRLGNLTWDGTRLVADEAEPPVRHQGRRWVGSVAEQVVAPAGRLRLRDRSAPEPLPVDPADPHHGGVAVEVQGSLSTQRLLTAEEDAHVLGHLGVGTTAPKVRLHVVGGNDATLAETSGYAVLGETSGPNLVLDPNELQARAAGAPATLHLQARGGDLVVHQQQADARVLVQGDTGRVGIGTLTPQTKLHVVGGTDVTLADESGYLVLGAIDGENLALDNNEIQARNVGARATLFLQAEGGDLVAHQHQPEAQRLVLKDDGRLGVGTAAPRVKLHVQGGSDVTLADDAGFLVLGSVDGENLALDGNEVQARLDGSASPLYLNREGGGVFVHQGQTEDRQIALTALGRLGVGTQSPRVPLHVRQGTDIVSGAKSRGHLILGDDDGFNLAFDNDEIQAKNNGAVATLHLQADGGRVEIHFNRAASERVVVTEGGNVGIGTATPNVKLHVQGSVRASSYLFGSDARWKEEVAELDGALETVTRLRGVRYRWRPEAAAEMGFEPGPQLGFLAQELEPHCPEAVDTDEEGMKSIRPHALLPLLVEAVKALVAENEALEARLARLEAAIAKQG